MSSNKKRKAEEEKAEQPTKKAKVEPRKLWQVVWTTFLDDYKARGNDWSETDTYHFASRKAAERFLFNKLHEWVEDEREQITGEEEEAEDDKAWRDAHKGLEAMEGYVEGFTDGEFVPCKLHWSLEEVVLTKAPKANHKCGCDLVPDSEPETEEVQASKSAKSEEASTSSTQLGA